jgi:hypothetical protein
VECKPTGDLLNGYRANNEIHQEGTSCWNSKSDQQGEGSIVGARCTPSANANRSKPGEARIYRAQDANPERCIYREGRDLDDQALPR